MPTFECNNGHSYVGSVKQHAELVKTYSTANPHNKIIQYAGQWYRFVNVHEIPTNKWPCMQCLLDGTTRVKLAPFAKKVETDEERQRRLKKKKKKKKGRSKNRDGKQNTTPGNHSRGKRHRRFNPQDYQQDYEQDPEDEPEKKSTITMAEFMRDKKGSPSTSPLPPTPSAWEAPPSLPSPMPSSMRAVLEDPSRVIASPQHKHQHQEGKADVGGTRASPWGFPSIIADHHPVTGASGPSQEQMLVGQHPKVNFSASQSPGDRHSEIRNTSGYAVLGARHAPRAARVAACIGPLGEALVFFEGVGFGQKHLAAKCRAHLNGPAKCRAHPNGPAKLADLIWMGKRVEQWRRRMHTLKALAGWEDIDEILTPSDTFAFAMIQTHWDEVVHQIDACGVALEFFESPEYWGLPDMLEEELRLLLGADDLVAAVARAKDPNGW